MTRRIVSDPVRVWEFVWNFTPVPFAQHMKGLGLEQDGELTAGVLYEKWNGVNIWAHIALAPGRRMVCREFLRYGFYYPFVELGCRRISGSVEASNTASRQLTEHLGFRQEAVLHGAASDGGAVILYVMRREDCRYV